jgi:hypothetical protein
VGVGIAEADLALDQHIQSYRELYNWVPPHESLGQLPPMVRYLAQPPEPAHESHKFEDQGVEVS